ncbi:hypothetical protein LG296_01735 [Ureibacillus chungkukjangi]|uniref:hypothetical protein n=1 Tax=Ureibacillus chungkukjangi TaxID=1202712 RepID=UPI00384BFBDC
MLQKARMNIKTEEGYDTLYPETSSDQVIDLSSGKNLETVIREVDEHVLDGDRHITPVERTTWNGKETPEGARKQIEQTDFQIYKSNKDSEGTFTTVEYKRTDGTLAVKSILSGGTAPNYTTRTITYYGANGTSVEKTTIRTLSYDSDGVLVSEV